MALFSSNIARVQTLARVAVRLGRELVLAGRSLERTVSAARTAGYLQDLPPVVPARHFGYLPRDRALVLCTGSPGELRAALSRVAADAHPHLYLSKGDTVVFSARAIPGNELSLQRLDLLLAAKEAQVVKATDAHVHVSGHPCRDELRTFYRWIRPKLVVPVHGTPAKLEAHARLAESLDLPALRVRNGMRVQLGPAGAQHVDTVRTGRVERCVRADRRGQRRATRGGFTPSGRR